MSENNTPSLEDLQKENEGLKKSNAQLKSLNGELKNKLSGTKKELNTQKRIVSDSEGNKYILTVAKLTFGKKEYTHAALQDLPKVVDQMIAKGVDVLKEA